MQRILRRLGLPTILGLTFALVVPVACKKKATPDLGVELVEPAKVPDGLLGDLVIAAPQQTLERLRTKVGGALMLAPSSVPSFVASVLGLPSKAGEIIDANLPIFGAASDAGGTFALALGVHIRDDARFVESLTAGAEAKFDKKTPENGVILITPKGASTATGTFLGVHNHYLLAGNSSAAITQLGPYIARTLSKRPPAGSGDLVLVAPRHALVGPVSKHLRDGWQTFRKAREGDDQELRNKHGGRSPDFGDPLAAITDIESKVNRLVQVLGDLDEARLIINAADTGLNAVLQMLPASGGGIASQELTAMRVGSVEPLLKVPRDSAFSFLMYDSEEQRKLSANEQAETLARLLGDRMTPPEKNKIADVLKSWAEGRGDWLTASLLWSLDQKTLALSGPVAQKEALQKAITDVIDLSNVPALREPLKHHLGVVNVSKPVTKSDGFQSKAKRQVKTTAADGKEKIETSEFDVAWRFAPSNDAFDLVVTNDAKAWFGTKDGSGPTLGTDPDAAKTLRQIGDEVAFILYIQPLRALGGAVDPAGAQNSAPTLFSYGRSKASGWYRLDMAYPAVRELMRLGLRR